MLSRIEAINCSQPKNDKREIDKSAENPDRFEGVPQGASTSPILAALALIKTLFKTHEFIIMYADNGLIYGGSNTPAPPLGVRKKT